MPEKKELKLSDAYLEPSSKTEEKELCLEVVATVLNINYGKNKDLMQKCDKLMGYSILIAKVREFAKEEENLEKAIKRAVDFCIEHDIIKEILLKNKHEVMRMLLQMTEEKYIKYQLEDARDEGLELGRELGRAEKEAEWRQKNAEWQLKDAEWQQKNAEWNQVVAEKDALIAELQAGKK